MDKTTKYAPDEKALLKKLQEDYDLVVAKSEQQMKDTHVAKEYTFSIVEKRRLLEQQTIKIIVENAVDDIINMSVLPRLGVTPSANVRVLYDVTLGRFTLFVPKEAPQESV